MSMSVDVVTILGTESHRLTPPPRCSWSAIIWKRLFPRMSLLQNRIRGETLLERMSCAKYDIGAIYFDR